MNTGIRQERSVILLTPEPCSDKSSMLESRIEQQSELISLMKRRSDDMIHELEVYQKKCKELETAKDKLEEVLLSERMKCKTIENRFNVLSENHDEMIKIKNDYKKENELLRTENEALNTISSNTSTGITTLQDNIDSLRDELTHTHEKNKMLKERCDVLEEECACLKEREKCMGEEIRRLRNDVNKKKEQVKVLELNKVTSEKTLAEKRKTNKLLELSHAELKKSSQNMECELKRKTQSISEAESRVEEVENEMERLKEEFRLIDCRISNQHC